MATPVISFLDEAAAHSVDSTATYRKQQGVPRESPRLCEEKAGIEAHRQTNASAWTAVVAGHELVTRREHKEHDNTQRAGGNAGYRHRAVSRGHTRREVSWKVPRL